FLLSCWRPTEATNDRTRGSLSRGNADETEPAASPGFAERPDLGQERPGRARLVREMPGLIGDRRRLDEENSVSSLEAFAGPGEGDERVDRDRGNVDTLRPHLARDRFGENALRRLRWREAGEAWLAAQCRGVAGRYQRPALRRHLGRCPARQMQQRH